jgi:DnaJ-class molecular chaperone
MTRTADQEWEAITAKIDHDDEAAFRFGERVIWGTCPTCQGCGEGRFEGTRCWVCHGKSEVPVELRDDE